jgi:hypothetical protein
MDSPFETKIAEALEELDSSSKPSLRAVEKKYGVSRRTLQRRLNGGVSKQIARCSQQLLSVEQEELLISWILILETEGMLLRMILFERWQVKFQESQAVRIQ